MNSNPTNHVDALRKPVHYINMDTHGTHNTHTQGHKHTQYWCERRETTGDKALHITFHYKNNLMKCYEHYLFVTAQRLCVCFGVVITTETKLDTWLLPFICDERRFVFFSSIFGIFFFSSFIWEYSVRYSQFSLIPGDFQFHRAKLHTHTRSDEIVFNYFQMFGGIVCYFAAMQWIPFVGIFAGRCRKIVDRYSERCRIANTKRNSNARRIFSVEQKCYSWLSIWCGLSYCEHVLWVNIRLLLYIILGSDRFFFFSTVPFIFFFSVLGAASLSAKTVQPKFLPKVHEMNFVLLTESKNISVPLENPEQLWTNAEFKKDLPLVLLITGWTTNINDTNNALDTVYAAYRCRGNVNFVVNT